MNSQITNSDLIAFLNEFLSERDMQRVRAMSQSKKNSRLLLRLNQKINNVEHLIVESNESSVFFHFIPDAIAKKSIADLTTADLIPNNIIFVNE